LEDPLGLARALQDRGVTFRVGSVQRGTLHGEVGGVRVSFLEYRHALLAATLDWPALGCRIASLDDLAAMKLLAVNQRGTKKDFVDIHALGVRAFPLGEMLERFRRKFGVDDVSRVLYSLTYFGDAESAPMPAMRSGVRWEEVKAEICEWVKLIAHAGG
jgi:hypothetical protein